MNSSSSSSDTPEEALVTLIDAWTEQTHVPSAIYKTAMDVALHLRKFREMNHVLIKTSEDLMCILEEQRNSLRMKLKKEERMKKKITALLEKSIGKTMTLRSGRNKSTTR